MVLMGTDGIFDNLHDSEALRVEEDGVFCGPAEVSFVEGGRRSPNFFW